MKFPWVSRERLEDAERRLTATDTERLRLLDLVLGGAVPDRREHIRVVEAPQRQTEEVETHAERNPEQGAPASYTTPFDRTQARFRTAFKGGAIPAAFKARMN